MEKSFQAKIMGVKVGPEHFENIHENQLFSNENGEKMRKGPGRLPSYGLCKHLCDCTC